MGERQQPLILFVDDGYPESADYDDNYLVVDARDARSLLRRWLGLPARPASRPSRTVRRGHCASEPLSA